MAESQTVIERLFEYLSAKGISPSGLEKRAGLANGYLRNSKGGLGAQKLSDILKACPDLDATWLLTGEGEMMNVDQTNHVDCPGHADLDGASADCTQTFNLGEIASGIGGNPIVTTAGLAAISTFISGLSLGQNVAAAAAPAVVGGAGIIAAIAAQGSKKHSKKKDAPKSTSTVEVEGSFLGQIISEVNRLNDELLRLYRSNSQKDAQIQDLQAQIAAQRVSV